MSKFCTTCGAQLDDNATFCTSCGSPQNADSQQAQPGAAQPGAAQQGGYQDAAKNFANAAGNFASAAGQQVKNTFDGVTVDSVVGAMSIDNIKNVGKTKNKNTIIGLAVVALAIIVVIVIVCLCVTPGYEKAIKNYFKSIEKCDGKLYAKTQAKAVNEYIEDEYLDDSDYDTIEEYYEEEICAYMLEGFEDEYGDDIKIKVKVEKKNDIKKGKLNDVEDYFDEAYDASVDVSKGYKVKIEASVKGDEDDDEDSEWVYVYKIDGDWVVSMYELS